MKRHLQCAEQQVSPSNLTKYCACHTEWLACLIVVTYETSFTMRGATGVTIQPHQMLRLSRRKTHMLNPHHISNLMYTARSNRCHPPTSPNAAPATKNDTAKFQRKCAKTGETSFPMRGRSENDPRMIRPWSEHENANRNPPRNRGYFSTSPRAFSIEKYNVSRPILHSNLHQILRLPRKVALERHQVLRLPRKVTLELHQVLRLPRKVTLELHQILHLPRKMTRLLYRPHIWNVISNARSNRCHYPTSPNTAPATKNDTARCQRKSPKTGETSFPMRGRSENDPRMIRPWSEHENANRNPPRNRGYFSTSPRAFSIEKYNVSRPILHSNLRLPRKVTLELHQVVRLPRKVTLELHQVLRLPRKVTLELHQVLRLPRKVTLELHQVLRLPLYCNWTLLYSTLLDTTLLDSTLLDTILLDSTLLDSTLLDTSLLASILLDSTLLDLLYLILLYLTLLYLTYSTWLYSWLYST